MPNPSPVRTLGSRPLKHDIDADTLRHLVETGEEEEETIFTCRAKLFHFEDKQWKERGVGIFKVNVRYDEVKMNIPRDDSEDEEDGNNEKTPKDLEGGDEVNGKNNDLEEGGITTLIRKGRLLMRSEGVHRTILNSPIFKDMNVGTKEGGEPSGKTMMLTGLEDGKPKGFQIRVSLLFVSRWVQLPICFVATAVLLGFIWTLSTQLAILGKHLLHW